MILATANAGAAGGYASMILSFVLMIAFLYFFMIRPQQKEQKKKNAMLSAL
ncbi:MAG: preprotein translocase subunit YajC, partial [Eubacterium sp.]|nr:preprotein translocase subunit YajC [Eubacterium sp.]